jgi:hypothetical protein
VAGSHVAVRDGGGPAARGRAGAGRSRSRWRAEKGARPLVVNGQLKRGVTIVMANRELEALLDASRRLAPLRFKGRTAWTVRRLEEPVPTRN